jgi:hypothetical protein
MHSRIGASIGGGLLGGIAFGLMMSMMSAPTPDGGEMNLMAMIGQVIGIPTVAAGWAYHLFNRVGHLVYGLILGGTFVRLHWHVPVHA